MDDNNKRKDFIDITESILGKTVKEAMSNIVSLYEEHSGTITAYDSDNSESLALAFKEGHGYLISDSPLMDKVVFKFSISGTGYHVFIELSAQGETEFKSIHGMEENENE
jgi:hypothetical protein